MNSILKAVLVLMVFVVACDSKKSSENNSKKPVNNPPPTTLKSFDYQPQKPVDGELWAVIELGSLGLNYFIVEIDDNGRWVLKEEKFGRSNIIYGANTLNEIIANIRNFKTEILAYGVKKDKIYMVASSSAIENDNTDLEVSLNELKIPLRFVSSKQEATYAMMATIPREFINESFLVDVGSGKTKLSWVNDQDTSTVEIHGSKYFLGDVQDTTVFREVRDALLEIPEENRNLCFMLGGIIYEFAKSQVDNQNDRYYILKEPDAYQTYNEKLKAGNVIYSALYLAPTYSYIFDSHSNFSIGYLVSLKQ